MVGRYWVVGTVVTCLCMGVGMAYVTVEVCVCFLYFLLSVMGIGGTCSNVHSGFYRRILARRVIAMP